MLTKAFSKSTLYLYADGSAMGVSGTDVKQRENDLGGNMNNVSKLLSETGFPYILEKLNV